MRILMIAPQPFFEPRGTPISVYQRLHGLSALNYEVDLVTYHLGKNVEIPGVTIHRIPNIPFIKGVKIGPSFAKIILDIVLFFKTLLMLITKKYDVIHSHEEAAFFAVIFAFIFRTRHLYDMHSSLSQQLESSAFGRYRVLVKLFEILERWVIHSCDSMLTIGADLEERAREINPAVNQTKVENLPVHVIDPAPDQAYVEELKESLGLNDRVPVVYTGTFEHYQGLDLLFDSAAIVKEQRPEICFVLVGGRPEQIEYWKAHVEANDLDDWVIFVGAVTPAETLAYLEMAEILVSPRTEGLSVPLKIYTYLYSGKPTVATDLIAHTQILDNENALIAAPQKEAFAEGIFQLAQDPNLRRRIGEAARKFAEEQYSPASYFAKLERVYKGLFFPPAPAFQAVGSPSKELLES